MKKSLLLLTFCFVLVHVNAQVTKESLKRGLTLYLSFDDTTVDSSGNNMDVNHYSTKYIDGPRAFTNNAVEFSGFSSSYITVANNDSLQMKNDFSIAFWLRADDVKSSDVQGVFYKGQDITNSYAMYLGQTDYRFILRNSPTSALGLGDKKQLLNACATDAFNCWTHHVIRYNAKTGMLKHYLDAALKDSFTFKNLDVTNDFPLVLGRHFTTPNGGSTFSYPLKGALDEFRLYRRLLSPEEITFLFDNITVGIQDKGATDNQINVYPTSSNTMALKASLPIHKIIVSNLLGQTVNTGITGLGTANVSVTVPSAGAQVYLLRIETAQGVSTKKLIL